MFFEKEVKILMVDFVGFEKTVKVLSYAKGIASCSNNAIAKAISKLDPRIDAADAVKEKEVKDFGVFGKVGNEKVLLGNERVMRENGIALNGDTSHKVFFAIDERVQAVFRLDE